MMWKEKNESGAVQMFVSTRNVIGFCPICSPFVVTVTGHLCGSTRGQGNGETVLLMIQHATLVVTGAHSPHVDLRWLLAHCLGFLGETLVTRAACENHPEHELFLRRSLSPHTQTQASVPSRSPWGLICSRGGAPQLGEDLPPASSATSRLCPHSPAGEKPFCLPEEKPEGFLGIGVRDVIFLVCGKSFSLCKVNTTKRLEHSGKKNHSCCCFYIGPGSAAWSAMQTYCFCLHKDLSLTPRKIGCCGFDLCGFLC